MTSLRNSFFACAISVIGLTSAAGAEDYGTLGETFEIVEPDLLEWIAERLQLAQDSGALDEINQEMADRTERTVRRPHPVLGIATAMETKTWLFDPSITVPEDIADHRGVVFASAGDRVNPFDTISLRKIYLFVDGDDEDQVAWALDERERVDGAASIVLTSGAPLDLMTDHQVRFFFDQGGFFTQRFAITAVPASMRQEGQLVRLTEHGPSEWHEAAERRDEGVEP